MNVLFDCATSAFLLKAAHCNSEAQEACGSLDAGEGRLCEHLESYLCSAGTAGTNLMMLGRFRKDMYDADMLDPQRRYRYKPPSANRPYGRIKVSHAVCLPRSAKRYCEQERALKRQLNRMARQCDSEHYVTLTDTTRRKVLAHIVQLESMLLRCFTDATVRIPGRRPTRPAMRAATASERVK